VLLCAIQTTSASRRRSAQTSVTIDHRSSCQRMPARVEPIAPPMKLLPTNAALRRLRAAGSTAKSLV
jgi:hypothetical protein